MWLATSISQQGEGEKMDCSVPYPLVVYWKSEVGEDGPGILVYTFRGLIRLNQTASLIWRLLDGRHTTEEILFDLRDHFPQVPQERLEGDLEEFLSAAEKEGLILRHWSPLQPYQVLSEELVP
jgi:hypothetical protein